MLLLDWTVPCLSERTQQESEQGVPGQLLTAGRLAVSVDDDYRDNVRSAVWWDEE